MRARLYYFLSGVFAELSNQTVSWLKYNFREESAAVQQHCAQRHGGVSCEKDQPWWRKHWYRRGHPSSPLPSPSPLQLQLRATQLRAARGGVDTLGSNGFFPSGSSADWHFSRSPLSAWLSLLPSPTTSQHLLHEFDEDLTSCSFLQRIWLMKGYFMLPMEPGTIFSLSDMKMAAREKLWCRKIGDLFFNSD